MHGGDKMDQMIISEWKSRFMPYSQGWNKDIFKSICSSKNRGQLFSGMVNIYTLHRASLSV